MILLLASMSGTTIAQTAPAQETDLERLLVPGSTVWLTDPTGRETRARIVGVADGVVTTDNTNDARGTLRLGDVRRVRVRETDSLLNGALIGAASAIAGGLFLCTLTEPWANCRDDAGPMVRMGSLGAGIGLAIDALIRDRRTVFEAPRGSARVATEPLVAPGVAGIRFSVAF